MTDNYVSRYWDCSELYQALADTGVLPCTTEHTSESWVVDHQTAGAAAAVKCFQLHECNKTTIIRFLPIHISGQTNIENLIRR